MGAAVPRYDEKDDIGGVGDDDQVVGRDDEAMVVDETDAIERDAKGGVEALVPADVLEGVMDDRADGLVVALDVGTADVPGVEDVERVTSDTFVSGGLSCATAVGGRGIAGLNARRGGPERAARELEELVEATAAVPGVPREEVKGPELREALVGAENDVIEGPGGPGVIKAVEFGVSNSR